MKEFIHNDFNLIINFKIRALVYSNFWCIECDFRLMDTFAQLWWYYVLYIKIKHAAFQIFSNQQDIFYVS